MLAYDFKLISSLEKIFPDLEPKGLPTQTALSGFAGETISFQLAYRLVDEQGGANLKSVEFSVISELKDNLRIRHVELVPVQLPAYGSVDDDYITTAPGLFPDLLRDCSDHTLTEYPRQWRGLWFDLEITKDLEAKDYPVKIQIKYENQVIWEDGIVLSVLGAELPAQQLIHTEWFHTDCLSHYYQVPVFSEEYFRILENFMRTAVKHGINMILTPVFTPPLDTQEGGERTTVQLVGVKKTPTGYSFDFTFFRRWIAISKRAGMEYIEISHLFTQWGAKHAPKVMAEVDGAIKRIFGWETDATGEDYAEFLNLFLMQLKEVLKEEQVFENTYFHISDEPRENDITQYAAAKAVVHEVLKDCKLIDALSSFTMYQKKVVEHPIPCSNHIQPFLDANIPDLWTYHCCSQMLEVGNRFMAMPSARNRILGVQLYLYKIKGFLHWGYNFYNTRNSIKHINPYYVTDGEGGFPAGDPFIVYPGEGGVPEESLRLMVLSEAMYDLRAFYFLESLAGREAVEKLIYEDYSETITFSRYPKNAEYLLTLREKVNHAIVEKLKNK